MSAGGQRAVGVGIERTSIAECRLPARERLCRRPAHDFQGLASGKRKAFSVLSGLLLERKRTDDVERGLSSDGIVEAADVATDRGGPLGAVPKGDAPDAFAPFELSAIAALSNIERDHCDQAFDAFEAFAHEHISLIAAFDHEARGA